MPDPTVLRFRLVTKNAKTVDTVKTEEKAVQLMGVWHNVKWIVAAYSDGSEKILHMRKELH